MRQSCILNYNPNFANNDPYNFDTNFNKELELNENSEVALYNLQISRKPIVITNDRELTLEIISDFPSPVNKQFIEDVRENGAGVIQANNIIANMSNTSITCLVEKGEYTKQEFLMYVGDLINDEIQDYNTASPPYNGQGAVNFNNRYGAANTQSRNTIPYYCEFKEDDNGLFFGLVRDQEPSVMKLDYAFGATGAYAGNIYCEVPIQGMVCKMAQDGTLAGGSMAAAYSGNISVAPVDGDGHGAGDVTLGTYVRGRDFLSPCYYNKWDNKEKTLTGNKISSFEYTLEIDTIAVAADKYVNCCFWNALSSQQFNGTGAAANSELAAGNILPFVRTIMGPGAGVVGNGAYNVETTKHTENMSATTHGALGQVPLCFLGMRKHIQTDVKGNILVNDILLYQNSKLQASCAFEAGTETYRTYPYTISGDMEELATINCRSQLNPNGKNYSKFRWNFFAMDARMDGNEVGKPTGPIRNVKTYYYQLMAFDEEGCGDWCILYDSQHTGKGIPQQIFEDGETYFNALNPIGRDQGYSPDNQPKTSMLGMCPLFTFQGCAETDSVQDPMGVFGCDYFGDGAAGTARPFLTRSIEQYSLSGLAELKKIFGCPRTADSRIGPVITFAKNAAEQFTGRNLKNPNMYPQHIGHYSGYVRIYGDGLRYNIELNLPIKCFATKAPNAKGDKEPGFTGNSMYQTLVVQGNERPVIYNFGNFGLELTDSNETSIYLELEPSNLKFLSLDNKQKIKLNNLKVKVRRAGSDEIAKEIEDCSLEILIQN